MRQHLIIRRFLLGFGDTSLDEDRDAPSVIDAIATNKRAHAMVMRSKAVIANAPDHPQRMPLYGGDQVADDGGIEPIALSWSKPTEQRNALSAVIAFIIEDLDTEVAVADQRRREWPCGLSHYGVLGIVSNDVMVHIDHHLMTRRTIRGGDRQPPTLALLNQIVDDADMHRHPFGFIEKYHRGDAISVGAGHGIIDDDDAVVGTPFPLHENVMSLAAMHTTGSHGGKSLRTIIHKDVVLDHGFMRSRHKYPMLAMAADLIACDQDTCSWLVADAVATAIDHRKTAEDTAMPQEHQTLPLAYGAKGDVHGSLTIDAAGILSHPRQGDTWGDIQREALASVRRRITTRADQHC